MRVAVHAGTETGWRGTHLAPSKVTQICSYAVLVPRMHPDRRSPPQALRGGKRFQERTGKIREKARLSVGSSKNLKGVKK